MAPTNCWLRTCFLCILRNLEDSHQEEARDHDADPVAHHAWKKPDARLPEVVAQFGVVM